MTSSTDMSPSPSVAAAATTPVAPPQRRPRRRSRSGGPPPRAPFRRFHLVLYLMFGAVVFSTAGAFAWIVNVSLKSDTEFISTGTWSITQSWQWDNYVQAWTSANVGSYFANSVVVSVGATVLGVTLAVFAAYPIARVPFRVNNLVLSVFLLGLMVPWMVTFIPLYLTMQEIGLLDSRIGLILVYATYNLPFNVFVLVGFMRTLPNELEEAAAVDGASPTRTFVSVIVPLMGPGLASVVIISFLNNWNEFFYALVLIHSPEKMTLPLGLFQLGQAAEYGTRWTTLFAGMMITVVPVLILFALLQNRITKGLTAGALKG